MNVMYVVVDMNALETCETLFYDYDKAVKYAYELIEDSFEAHNHDNSAVYIALVTDRVYNETVPKVVPV